MGYDYFGGLQRSVGQWADNTFTKATDVTIVTHLGREVEELRASILEGESYPEVPRNQIRVAEELADCLLLLMHLAHRNGISLEEAARVKDRVNRQRTWGTPDVEGVVEHVREG